MKECNDCGGIASVFATSEPFGWRRDFCNEHIPQGWSILQHYKEGE